MTDMQRTRVIIALICTLFFAMDQLFPKQASLTAWVFLVTSWAATAWSLWSDEQ